MVDMGKPWDRVPLQPLQWHWLMPDCMLVKMHNIKQILFNFREENTSLLVFFSPNVFFCRQIIISRKWKSMELQFSGTKLRTRTTEDFWCTGFPDRWSGSSTMQFRKSDNYFDAHSVFVEAFPSLLGQRLTLCYYQARFCLLHLTLCLKHLFSLKFQPFVPLHCICMTLVVLVFMWTTT